MSNLEALFESEIPSGRQALQDSYTNLQDVAAYCEDNYLKCDNKRGALEETKNYTTQALASVAYQINTLATGMLQMLDLQATQLAQMESSINHITQNVNVHKEKVARREIGVLTTSKNCPRTHKIVAPANPEKPMKYKSTPIDFAQLDNIGHGMVLTSNVRATRTPGAQRSRRTPSIGSQASTGTTESGGIMAISQPGVDTRDPRFNSLGRGSRVKQPAQPPAAPTPPVNYASATLPRMMPSDMRQSTGVPTRTPSFQHQQGPPQGYMQGMPPPAAPPPPEMMGMMGGTMGHRRSQGAPGPMHPTGMPPPPPIQQPGYPGGGGIQQREQRMSFGDQQRGMGEQRMSMGEREQRMSIGEQQQQRMSFGSDQQRLPAGVPSGYGIPAAPPPPPMMMGGGGGDMPPPPDSMSPPPPPPPPDMGYMGDQMSMPPPPEDMSMPPPPVFLQEEEPDWVPPNYVEKVIAIYDYAKEREDELTFEEGSTIYVLKKNPDGWYEGIMDGTTGLFPGNYVEVCP
ncbi:LOW QUALITY PROTEIN: abl interactor 2-like [Amphiura filiformis]|uniref:LOW QUALITY PROTEIN: abl interactor 2-like n=1 Tax=Amphiura filiformis TaxID=82378 RepID=UPI003B216AEE